MTLNEALETHAIGYKGTRPDYQIHDHNPNVLMLDKDYNVDGHGNSVLGFNFNYLNELTAKQKKSLLARINKVDNKVLNINAAKAFLRKLMRKGDYKGLSKDKKIERYRRLVKDFPELKKVIRRYKYDGITKGV